MADYTDFYAQVREIKALPEREAVASLLEFVRCWKATVGRDIEASLGDLQRPNSRTGWLGMTQRIRLNSGQAVHER